MIGDLIYMGADLRFRLTGVMGDCVLGLSSPLRS